MEKEAFDKYVQERYIKQMEYYSNSASKNQKRYKTFQWILIVLSALTPVLAALSAVTWSHEKEANTGSQMVQVLLVAVSSVVAILTTGLKTFQYQELWAIYRSSYEQLRPEYYYYEFAIGPYAATGIDKESLFVSRIEAILNKERTQWPASKKLQDKQEKQET